MARSTAAGRIGALVAPACGTSTLFGSSFTGAPSLGRGYRTSGRYNTAHRRCSSPVYLVPAVRYPSTVIDRAWARRVGVWATGAVWTPNRGNRRYHDHHVLLVVRRPVWGDKVLMWTAGYGICRAQASTSVLSLNCQRAHPTLLDWTRCPDNIRIPGPERHTTGVDP